MPLSSPTQVVDAAASPLPGRIELVAGHGSSTITFPLFDHNEHDHDKHDHDKHDHDVLYTSRLDLSQDGVHRAVELGLPIRSAVASPWIFSAARPRRRTWAAR
ncbi:hypothetical protein [Streptomyces europaeiscabiei]|uniref:hypothetical protein n=1 Tax=Streptomyces europaeiscabiei TaxID=146819 RepID=UPI0029A459CE|nr:hypothetical protein [Streptomyces europaeiscabiei]MDX3615086.1 hypothetical protein [Streptomyces europaeiscabiei]